MRVTVWRSLLLPGSETFIRNQADAMTRWRPTLLGAVPVPSALSRDTDVLAFPSGRAHFLLLRLTGGSRRLARFLAATRPDVVHAHFAGDGWLISRSAARAGVPLVITAHGLDVTRQAAPPGPRGARYRRNLRTAFHRAALILAVSEAIRDRIIALGADPAKVRVHYTGVPIPPPGTVAAQWDVLFVGRFVEKKGVDDLLTALAMMPGTSALFIGTGPLEPAMRARAADLGLDATFLGAQDPSAVAHHLAASRVFAAPSKTAADGDTEGLPTTILEASAAGVPVVSTYHSGIPEAVVEGETGLLGPEGDAVTLAANLRRLLKDDELRARLGRQGRRHVETYFNLPIQTRKLEDLYTSVIRHRTTWSTGRARSASVSDVDGSDPGRPPL